MFLRERIKPAIVAGGEGCDKMSENDIQKYAELIQSETSKAIASHHFSDIQTNTSETVRHYKETLAYSQEPNNRALKDIHDISMQQRKSNESIDSINTEVLNLGTQVIILNDRLASLREELDNTHEKYEQELIAERKRAEKVEMENRILTVSLSVISIAAAVLIAFFL